MNLLELAKNIKRNLYIEIRPTGEYIISFGTDCTLIEQSMYGKHRHKTLSVHGRGQTLREAVRNFVIRLSHQNSNEPKLFFLRFPANFDTQGDVRVNIEGLAHEENLIT